MNSQHDEERVLLEILPVKGRMCDVGAYTGREFSNSLALIEKGWSAVCIEARLLYGSPEPPPPQCERRTDLRARRAVLRTEKVLLVEGGRCDLRGGQLPEMEEGPGRLP